MKLRMTETARGSEDGYTVQAYESGEEYDIGPELAAVFLAEKWAVEVAPEPPAEQTPVKAGRR